jgi:hypothetical protein
VGVEDFANYSCHASNSLGRAKGAIQLRGKFYPTLRPKSIIKFKRKTLFYIVVLHVMVSQLYRFSL